VKKHLIAIDLDGTALYNMWTMTDLTINTLKKINELGHEVVISTGRAFRTSTHFYNLLDLKTPIINHNGALISNPTNDEFKRIERFVSYNDVIKIFMNNKMYIQNAFAEYLEDYYVLEYNDFMKGLIHPDPQGGDIIEGPFNETLKINVNGFLIVAKENKGHLIEKYIKENFNGKIDCRNWGGNNSHIIEVFISSTDKGSALKYVADYLEIDIKNVIAFGDGDNDIGMLEIAGLGVAMSNATVNAKKASDLIIGHHQEDSVANYLISYFKIG